MPLPENGTAWPPRALAPIRQHYEANRAWWTGDIHALVNSTSAMSAMPANRRAVNPLKLFWPRQASTQESTARTALHVPLAATIAGTSADQLYASPPAIKSDDNKTTDRIAEYIEHGLHGALLEGAELSAVYGGRFHVATLIPGINEGRPFLAQVDPQNVYPEFTWGQLTAANIVIDLEATSTGVLRHIERHELDAKGNGLVFHGLYRGSAYSLGRAVPLTEHDSTRRLAEELTADGQSIGIPTPGLNIFYVPNRLPQRKFRHIPGGQYLGRSDYDGLHAMFDALDEAWTSWLRDLRLGKSRIMVARHMLEPPGTGGAHTFDLEREVFTPLENVLPAEDGRLPVEKIQFDIRVKEHQQTVQELTAEILRSAGYSPSTYGYQLGGIGITATEIRSREKATLTTRGRKINHEAPFVRQAVTKLLALDAQANPRAGLDPHAPLTVEFPATVQESMRERAETANMMATANAASTYTRIAYMNPDWSDEDVAKEMNRILEEEAIPIHFPETYQPLAEEDSALAEIEATEATGD